MFALRIGTVKNSKNFLRVAGLARAMSAGAGKESTETSVDLYLNRRLGSQVIHDLNTVIYYLSTVRQVCVGTHEAKQALMTDQQLADRFEAWELPPWQDDPALLQLLASFAAILPLRRASELRSSAHLSKIARRQPDGFSKTEYPHSHLLGRVGSNNASAGKSPLAIYARGEARPASRSKSG